MRLLLILGLAVGIGGCGDNQISGDTDAGVSDGAVASDGGGDDGSVPLSWIDFTISGCASGGSDNDEPCAGAAPLTVRFVALAPSPIETFRWTFSDDRSDAGPDPRPTPEHTFELPGTYDVSLVAGGPGGTASVDRDGAVIVAAAQLGATCEVAEQCESEACICGSAAECGPSLDNGLCSTRCTDSCADGACVDLKPSGPVEPADWQDLLCLPTCADGVCPAGLTCGSYLDHSGAFVRACFADGVLGQIGESCRDLWGAPDDSACASGECLDEGARAMCSATCSSDDCPDSAACASFNGGESHCLLRCDTTVTCDDDPWLACQVAGGPGPKGFTVDEAPDAAGYCAPKTCAIDADCGPDGVCDDDDFCAAAL